MPPIVIAPSVLSADFARLGEEVRTVGATARAAAALIAGSAIFGAKGYKSAVAAIRAGADAAVAEP